MSIEAKKTKKKRKDTFRASLAQKEDEKNLNVSHR
jgi:hypothetical protein